MKNLQPLNTPVKETSISAYIESLLQSVAIVHAMHLTTLSYARHKALDEYYKDMPELIDAFAESYISQEEVKLEPRISFNHSSAEDLLKSLKEVGLMLHKGMCPSLTNPLEDILTKIHSILYKLRLS